MPYDDGDMLSEMQELFDMRQEEVDGGSLGGKRVLGGRGVPQPRFIPARGYSIFMITLFQKIITLF